MSDKQLAGVLDRGDAGLVVVYATNMADQISAAVTAENTYVSEAMAIDQAALDKEIAAASSS